MNVSYYSLGCKVNLYESEAIINQFLDNGFTLKKFNEVCDVYIINTCSITAVSDAKSRKIIREAIKTSPNAVVAVMGCYAQLKPEDIQKISGVDIIIGTSNRDKLYDLVMECLKNKTSNSLYEEILDVKTYEELKIRRYNSKTRGFVKIEDGCDNYCSYCTIPYARGHVRSRKPENVINEIQDLTNQGMKEIVLTGISTGSYGADLDNYDFATLLNDLVKNVKNLGRIRISSIEITEITDKLLNVIKNNEEHFCMHLHIPLQGGCDNTLKNMHRKYSILEYKQKIEKIRSMFDDINITTDVLAGFAGETKEDFKDSYEFIKSMNFGEMHVFPYSRRPRTIAYNFDKQIDDITKRYRVNELIKLNNENALKYRMKYNKKIVKVLVEKNENGLLFGHTSNYMEVRFKGTSLPNTYVQVYISSVGYPESRGEEI